MYSISVNIYFILSKKVRYAVSFLWYEFKTSGMSPKLNIDTAPHRNLKKPVCCSIDLAPLKRNVPNPKEIPMKKINPPILVIPAKK